MAYKHFRPTPGRYGMVPALLSSAVPTCTANATVTVYVPTPAISAYVESASFLLTTLAADADGILTVKLFKWDKSAGAGVALTDAMGLETGDAAVVKEPKKFTIGAVTEAARTLEDGDSLYLDYVSNSAAIDTQPVGFVVVELAILE